MFIVIPRGLFFSLHFMFLSLLPQFWTLFSTMLLVLTPSYCAIILKAPKRLNVRVLLHVLYPSKIEEVLLLKANHY